MVRLPAEGGGNAGQIFRPTLGKATGRCDASSSPEPYRDKARFTCCSGSCRLTGPEVQHGPEDQDPACKGKDVHEDVQRPIREANVEQTPQSGQDEPDAQQQHSEVLGPSH